MRPRIGRLAKLVLVWYNTGMEQEQQSKKVSFVFPLDVLEGMRKLAKAHQRSLIGEIIWALRHYITQQQESR